MHSVNNKNVTTAFMTSVIQLFSMSPSFDAVQSQSTYILVIYGFLQNRYNTYLNFGKLIIKISDIQEC